MAETPTILVTGGTGKVGGRLSHRLKESGFSVRIIPAHFAAILAKLEYKVIKNGLEDHVTPTVERVTGRPPRSLADFATTLHTGLSHSQQAGVCVEC